MRACRSHDAIDERGSQPWEQDEDRYEYELKFGRVATTKSRLRIITLDYWQPIAARDFTGRSKTNSMKVIRIERRVERIAVVVTAELR